MRHPPHFDCREFFARLEDYVDRELSADDIRRIEEHLAICEPCTREYRFEYRLLCALKAKLRCVNAPDGLMERIRHAIAENRPT